MSDSLVAVMTALTERLLTLALEDPILRGELRALSELVLARTAVSEKSAAAPAPPPAVPVAGNHAPPPALAVAPAPPAPPPAPAVSSAPPAPKSAEPPRVEDEPDDDRPREPLPELTFGRIVVERPQLPPTVTAAGPTLEEIEGRCRLKAEGARWAAERRRRLAAGADYVTEIEPKDQQIFARGKELECYLWMCNPSGPNPSDLAQYEEVAGCFEAVAEGTILVRDRQEQGDLAEFEKALYTLAEAQSALRMAVVRIGGPTDQDQFGVFNWLRNTASDRQIFIQRHMRLDDPANPARWPELLARITEQTQKVHATKHKQKEQKRLLGKVRHKAKLIQDDPVAAEGEWPALIDSVTQLVDQGLPPSNRELREYLLPIIDALPENEFASREFDLVLQEIDRYLADKPLPTSTAQESAVSAEVRKAAELLHGKSLVLIGGDKRQAACAALKQALELQDLVWIETRAHESISGFEPAVARPDVAAVLLAIRWASHSYGDVKGFCDAYDKPLVRLPAGYNPNQVATQILAQASGRLR